MRNNRSRILSEVLSLDAWHDPLRVDGTSSAVYVELTFSEGRIGGNDAQIPFTFRLSLKKALLTIKVEDSLAIDRTSIARSIPQAQVELSKIMSAKQLAESSLVGKAKISPASLHVALTGDMKRESAVSQEDQLHLIQTVPETLVTPRANGNNSYSWELQPSFNPTLQNQPWHPVDAPRMKIKPRGKLGKILPTVSVTVSCAVEDMDISELKPKSDTINGKIRNLIHNDVSQAAAIQHLKIILSEADLEPSEMDNRFSNFLIANVLALSE